MTPTDVALLDEAHWLIDPGLPALRPRGRRRGAEPDADGAADDRAARARAVADDPRRPLAAHRRRRRLELGAPCCDEAGVDAHVVSELRVSYRVPNEFLVLAGTLLPAGRAGAARRARGAVPAGRDRAPTTSARRPRAIAARLADEVGSVGVVAPRACLRRGARRARRRLRRRHRARRWAPGINLLDLHVAKGLEFDAIVVVEPAAILAERPDGGVGGLYTALTRATRALAIVHARAAARGPLEHGRVADRN